MLLCITPSDANELRHANDAETNREWQVEKVEIEVFVSKSE
jgi:hypothetical protein